MTAEQTRSTGKGTDTQLKDLTRASKYKVIYGNLTKMHG